MRETHLKHADRFGRTSHLHCCPTSLPKLLFGVVFEDEFVTMATSIVITALVANMFGSTRTPTRSLWTGLAVMLCAAFSVPTHRLFITHAASITSK
jgi:hypothetical protein